MKVPLVSIKGQLEKGSSINHVDIFLVILNPSPIVDKRGHLTDPIKNLVDFFNPGFLRDFFHFLS